MPSIFSAMKTRKTKRHRGNRTPKRTLPAATTMLSTSNHAASSGISSESGSKHSPANDGQSSVTSASPSSPPIDSSSEMKSKDSGSKALTILPPTPKTLAQPELSRVVSQNPTTKLARKTSKVSFSDMKFGGTSVLGGTGHGRKSHQQGAGDDKILLNDLRKQPSTVDGRSEDKDAGHHHHHPPIHGIMKTATNVSVGAGTHSVRFTLDLPPQLDLDLSLSDERGESGNLDKKDGAGLTRKPSRWERKTTEAVLDRSKVVSTEFIPLEDDQGRNGDEGKEDLKEVGGVSPNDLTNKTVSLHEQQSVQRDPSRTSLISTLECEPSFTIYRLEDLAAGLEFPPNGRRALPVVPNLGRVSSCQERVFSRNGMLRPDSGAGETVRNTAPSMNNSRIVLTRKESYKGYSDGCVSA